MVSAQPERGKSMLMLDIIGFLFGIIGIMLLLSIIICITLFVPVIIKSLFDELKEGK